VNVLVFGSNEREFCIEYLSPHRDRAHHVNLFVIEENGNHHYVWIKDMSRLVAGRTKHNRATHVCNSCLHPFRDKIVLERYIPYCLRHSPQVVKYPNPENEDECTVKFRGHHKQHRIPFYLVCDFESFLSPANDEEVNNSRGTHVIHEYHVTPINSEKYIMFEIGKLRFIDSFQFLSTSLENLVSILLKSGKDNFEHTRKYLGDNEMVFAKGVYPYSYMSSREKFDETELPSIESFHVTLNDEPLPPEDYERAKAIWKHFDIGNMRQYHDHYLIFYLTFFCLRMFSKIFEIPSWLNTNSTAYIT